MNGMALRDRGRAPSLSRPSPGSRGAATRRDAARGTRRHAHVLFRRDAPHALSRTNTPSTPLSGPRVAVTRRHGTLRTTRWSAPRCNETGPNPVAMSGINDPRWQSSLQCGGKVGRGGGWWVVLVFARPRVKAACAARSHQQHCKSANHSNREPAEPAEPALPPRRPRSAERLRWPHGGARRLGASSLDE